MKELDLKELLEPLQHCSPKFLSSEDIVLTPLDNNKFEITVSNVILKGETNNLTHFYPDLTKLTFNNVTFESDIDFNFQNAHPQHILFESCKSDFHLAFASNQKPNITKIEVFGCNVNRLIFHTRNNPNLFISRTTCRFLQVHAIAKLTVSENSDIATIEAQASTIEFNDSRFSLFNATLGHCHLSLYGSHIYASVGCGINFINNRNTLSISQSTIEFPIEFRDLEEFDFSALYTTLDYAVTFSRCSFERFDIHECKFDGIFISNSQNEIQNGAQIQGCSIKKLELFASKFHFSQIYTQASGFFGSGSIHELIISSCPNLQIVIENAKLIHLDLTSCTLSSQSEIIIRNTELNSIKIENVINAGRIQFASCYQSSLEAFSSYSKAPLQSSFALTIHHYVDRLHMVNSDLGKFELLHCLFHTFSTFAFRGCNTSGWYISSSTLPKSLSTGITHLMSTHDHPKLKKLNDTLRKRMINVNKPIARLSFYQLKKIFENQGDQVKAHEYYVKEMVAYWHELTTTNGITKKFFLWLQLSLNYLTTTFGKSYIKGILVTIGIYGLLTHWLFINTLGVEYHFTLINIDWDITKSLTGHFFKFLSPFRSFNYETGIGPLTWSSHIADFFARVFITYGFYETIQAFRRHGKK